MFPSLEGVEDPETGGVPLQELGLCLHQGLGADPLHGGEEGAGVLGLYWSSLNKVYIYVKYIYKGAGVLKLYSVLDQSKYILYLSALRIAIRTVLVLSPQKKTPITLFLSACRIV